MYLENKNKFHKIPELSACAHVNLINILKTLELLWFIRGEGHNFRNVSVFRICRYFFTISEQKTENRDKLLQRKRRMYLPFSCKRQEDERVS